MRVVLDTNILLSALINRHGTPARLITAWREHRYHLLTSTEQLLELGSVARRPVLRARIIPSTVGRLIRDLRRLAEVMTSLPEVERSADPADNFLLAMAELGEADYLVSGDRRGVLVLGTHDATQIISAGEFLALLGIKPAKIAKAEEIMTRYRNALQTLAK
jgi:putative PIN family toxin of toxin-antitoxin system